MPRAGVLVPVLVSLLAISTSAQTSGQKVINVGVHVGSRMAFPGARGYSIAISTTDTTVQVDTVRTGGALLAGANVTVFPFARPELHWFGFMLNLNLINVLDIANSRLADLGAGIGFAFRLDPRFAIGITANQYEQVQPVSWVVDLAGQQLLDADGNPVTSLAESGLDLYQTEQTRRLGVWFVFMF